MKLIIPKNPGKIIHKGKQAFKITEIPLIESDGCENMLKAEGLEGEFEIKDVRFNAWKNENLNGKTILMMRRGGYGDLLWISRLARELKKLYPDVRIRIATMQRHQMVFTENNDIDKILPYPLPQTEFNETDYQITFENCIERSRSEKSVYDLFAERLGITLKQEDKMPVYKLSSLHGGKSRKILKQMGITNSDKKVMIHMGASTPWKSYPPAHIFAIASTLGLNGIKVILGGNKNVFPFLIPEMKNVYQVCYKVVNDQKVDMFDMETSLSLMNRMDLLVGQDSGLTHFAAAMGIPCVVIYGPFPAAAYVGSYPLCTSIENRSGCDKSPCYPHLDNICTKMDTQSGAAPCLESVSPRSVLDEIEKKLHTKMQGGVTRVKMEYLKDTVEQKWNANSLP